METTGYHTCSGEYGLANVRRHAPFLSTFNEDKKKYNFLGTGYYFWDFNEEMAREWGMVHYKGQYFILKAELRIEDHLLLDLVGNMKHIRYFGEIIQLFRKLPNTDDWCLGKYIEMLKIYAKDDEEYTGLFQFIAIRAIDNKRSGKEQYHIAFSPDRDNYTNLDPVMTICIFDLDKIFLKPLSYLGSRKNEEYGPN